MFWFCLGAEGVRNCWREIQNSSGHCGGSWPSRISWGETFTFSRKQFDIFNRFKPELRCSFSALVQSRERDFGSSPARLLDGRPSWFKFTAGLGFITSTFLFVSCNLRSAMWRHFQNEGTFIAPRRGVRMCVSFPFSHLGSLSSYEPKEQCAAVSVNLPWGVFMAGSSSKRMCPCRGQ